MGDTSDTMYSELPPGRYIRLLYLAPGIGHDTITADLSTFELTEAPSYEALSYVWGHSGDVEPIVVDRSTVFITKNLRAALARVRYADTPRVIWADAICINQRNIKERGHHVGFMGAIYRQAERVLVCFGQDEDGRARDVVELVEETYQLVSKHKSVEEMPVLPAENPIFNDPRWASVATLTRCVWWTRTWVIQEVGLAKNPWALYGDCEFSYRKLMVMAMWVERCAAHLLLRAGVEFNTIHTEWMDWSPEWEKNNWAHDRNFLDLMNQGSWLSCADHRDHVFAMLGHPFAQLTGDEEPLVKPDYSTEFHKIYVKLALQLLKERKGLRLLSAVEHDKKTINEAFPSWVPYWTVQDTMTNLGIYSGFHYDALSGIDECPWMVKDDNILVVKGLILGAVAESFILPDLDETASGKPKDEGSGNPGEGVFEHIWRQALNKNSMSPYQAYFPTAFSLTLTAGLSGYDPAETNLQQHQDNFSAYLNYQVGSIAAIDLPGRIDRGDHEKFFLDMRFACTGRSFAFTENGYFVLGPAIMESADLCCIIFGASVPFVLRRTETDGRYKLVGEAYIHGLMRGEAKAMLDVGELQEEIIIV